MSTQFIIYTCLLLGLSAALVAGVFLSFSDFVMRALLLSSSTGGMESMQHINRTVFKSIFLAVFFVLAPASLSLAVYALWNLTGATQTLLIVAAVIYLILVFLVTIVGNVPMNEKLATMNHLDVEAHSYWKIYGVLWTRWNHIRTIGSIAASACYLLVAVKLI